MTLAVLFAVQLGGAGLAFLAVFGLLGVGYFRRLGRWFTD